jgi:hypothetical protein
MMARGGALSRLLRSRVFHRPPLWGVSKVPGKVLTPNDTRVPVGLARLARAATSSYFPFESHSRPEDAPLLFHCFDLYNSDLVMRKSA